MSAKANRKTFSPSMADVAKLAGVSQQTVSRVVNDAPNVADETRERVQKVMAELGFRPNYAGRTLRRGSYRSIGLFLYNVTEFGNLSTLDGIMGAAREHNYSVNMIEMGDDQPIKLAEASQKMLELPVDGLILSMSIRALDLETFRPSPGLSTVLLTMYEHPFCTTVDNDQYLCGKQVVDYLVGLGHKHIRFVAGPDHSVDSEFRQKGWQEALLAHGLEAKAPLKGNWLADSGFEAGVKLAADTEMDAVFVANDTMALGLIAALEERGLRVPEDVSVVGVDDSLVGNFPNVELTTVRFNMLSRGRAAIDNIISGKKPNYHIQHIRIPGKIIERKSVAARL